MKNEMFLWFWLILIFLILIIKIMKTSESEIESFTPKIKGFYRPYLRKVRLYNESLGEKYNLNYFINILRNIGIY